MRLVWLVALVASVAVIVGGVVGNVSNRRERAGERDEALRATTALSVAHVDAELTRIASVLRVAPPGRAVTEVAALLDGGVNVCTVDETTSCSSDEPTAPRDTFDRAVDLARVSSDAIFTTASGDATDGVVVVAVAASESESEITVAQITTRQLLAADVSLIPYQPLRAPRFVDDGLASDDASLVTRDDRRLFTLAIATEFDDGARFVVASSPAVIALGFGQRTAFVVSLAVGGIGLLLSLIVLVAQARQLSRRATTDDLTGLLTRNEFERRAAAQLARLEAEATGTATVVFVDLDEFKRVNDRAGHHVGDAVLADVASRLRDLAGDGDVIARWGGDEFVLLVDDADTTSASSRARTIEMSLRTIPSFDDGTISCSIGIATYPDDGRDVDELMRSADASMYHAKRLVR